MLCRSPAGRVAAAADAAGRARHAEQHVLPALPCPALPRQCRERSGKATERFGRETHAGLSQVCGGEACGGGALAGRAGVLFRPRCHRPPAAGGMRDALPEARAAGAGPVPAARPVAVVPGLRVRPRPSSLPSHRPLHRQRQRLRLVQRALRCGRGASADGPGTRALPGRGSLVAGEWGTGGSLGLSRAPSACWQQVLRARCPPAFPTAPREERGFAPLGLTLPVPACAPPDPAGHPQHRPAPGHTPEALCRRPGPEWECVGSVPLQDVCRGGKLRAAEGVPPWPADRCPPLGAEVGYTKGSRSLLPAGRAHLVFCPAAQGPHGVCLHFGTRLPTVP